MTSGDDIQVVAFRVGGQDFAFNVFSVERIQRYEPPIQLPKAPKFLEGIIHYEGGVIPIVDLRTRLGVMADIKDDTRVIVIESRKGKIGIVVDSVTEVIRLPAEEVAPPPEYVRGLAAKYIAGIISRNDRTVVLLKATELLSSKERLALKALAADE